MLNNTSDVFIIAELSANHNGSLDTAIETIHAAKECGADAIKLQTYTADTLTLNVKNQHFLAKKGGPWEDRYLYDLYQEAYTPWEWHEQLFVTARDIGLICFSTPFDKSAVDFLEELGNPIYKIASFEITDIPLIQYAASKGKPMILSTGVAGYEDIHLAVDACRSMNNDDITLLKCTSSYPAPIDEANLAMIPDMATRFNVRTGVSDHTPGITVPVAATILGAEVIEKHFILDKSIDGPDVSFSLDTEEFKSMVEAVREASSAIGTVDYELSDKQLESRKYARSLYVSVDMKAGEKITLENIKSVRPGHGLHPKYLNDLLGQTVNRDLEKGTPFKLDYLATDD